MNLEICFFNKKLKKHLASTNSVDIQMVTQLQETTRLICELLHGPQLIEADTVELAKATTCFEIHRQLYCDACNVAVKADVHRLREHVENRKHIKAEATLKVKNHLNDTDKSGAENHAFNNSGALMAPLLGSPSTRKDGGDATAKSVESPEVEVSIKKLSKKVKEFLRDCRLEHLAQKLLDEGERVMHSPSHTIISNQIVEVLKEEFSRVQVYPFGSRLSGLGSDSSDLDLYVDLNANYFNTPIQLTPKAFRHIEDNLRATKSWTEFVPIVNARTPIIRAYNLSEKIDCDLSFGNGLSHCNTRLINFFIDIQPLFGKVAAVVKHYAHVADFKMNSYIVTLLVVYYFQVHMLLPPVHEIQSKIEPKMIGRKYLDQSLKSLIFRFESFHWNLSEKSFNSVN